MCLGSATPLGIRTQAIVLYRVVVIGTTPAQIGKLESSASSPGPPVHIFAEASVMGNASTVVALSSLRVTALR